MPRRLPLLNVLLVGVSLVFALVIARELTTSPRPMAPRPQPATTAAAPAAPAATPPPPADGYTIIATRNLFSPTRTEAPPPPPQPPVSAAVNLPKPNLYGVVLRDGAPIAYLEDPVTKRVAGYRVGDTIAGGTVTTIADDTVMLARPEGQVTVRLHDPTRPRPPAPSAPARSPGAPVSPTGVAPQASPLPSSTSTVQPVPGSRPVRRPLPPSVVRRTPSPQATDAPTPK